MASGAASQMAAPAGVGVLRGPLLWVTIAIAVGITAAGVFFGPRLPRRWPRRAAATRFGDFTVPIGLAVIGSGLAGLRGPAPAAGAIGTGAIGTGAIGTGAIGTGAIGTGVAATSAIVVVTLAWAATGVLVATVLVPVAAGWPGLGAVGGAWFLAPAALLADATGTAAVASKVAGEGPALGWLAVVVAGMGAVSYLMVLGLAIARFAAHGLSGAPLSPWWVAAGCGGLSAAVLGPGQRGRPRWPSRSHASRVWLGGPGVLGRRQCRGGLRACRQRTLRGSVATVGWEATMAPHVLDRRLRPGCRSGRPSARRPLDRSVRRRGRCGDARLAGANPCPPFPPGDRAPFSTK